MFLCFTPLLSKVERVCHVIVMSSYLASSDGYIGSTIGRLQYKCTARLIITIIGYSTKWQHKRNGKKLVPTPCTCTLVCGIASLRSSCMDSAI